MTPFKALSPGPDNSYRNSRVLKDIELKKSTSASSEEAPWWNQAIGGVKMSPDEKGQIRNSRLGKQQEGRFSDRNAPPSLCEDSSLRQHRGASWLCGAGRTIMGVLS